MHVNHYERIILLICKGSLTCTFQNVYTVFIRIVAAATINFNLAWVWLLIEGGSCSKVAYIKFGPILDSVIHKNHSTVQPRLSGPRLSGPSIIRTSWRPDFTLPRMRRRRGQRYFVGVVPG